MDRSLVGVPRQFSGSKIIDTSFVHLDLFRQDARVTQENPLEHHAYVFTHLDRVIGPDGTFPKTVLTELRLYERWLRGHRIPELTRAANQVREALDTLHPTHRTERLIPEFVKPHRLAIRIRANTLLHRVLQSVYKKTPEETRDMEKHGGGIIPDAAIYADCVAVSYSSRPVWLLAEDHHFEELHRLMYGSAIRLAATPGITFADYLARGLPHPGRSNINIFLVEKNPGEATIITPRYRRKHGDRETEERLTYLFPEQLVA